MEEIYFNGTVWINGDRINFPVLALQAGRKNPGMPWSSASVTSGPQFRTTFERLHEQVPLTIAVLGFHMPFLIPTVSQYDRLDVVMMAGMQSRAMLRLSQPSISAANFNGSNFPTLPRSRDYEINKMWGIYSVTHTYQIEFFVRSDALDITI